MANLLLPNAVLLIAFANLSYLILSPDLVVLLPANSCVSNLILLLLLPNAVVAVAILPRPHLTLLLLSDLLLANLLLLLLLGPPASLPVVPNLSDLLTRPFRPDLLASPFLPLLTRLLDRLCLLLAGLIFAISRPAPLCVRIGV